MISNNDKWISYTLEYNHTTKTWCVFKNIETKYGYNFYAVYESEDKKGAQEMLEQVRAVKK